MPRSRLRVDSLDPDDLDDLDLDRPEPVRSRRRPVATRLDQGPTPLGTDDETTTHADPGPATPVHDHDISPVAPTLSTYADALHGPKPVPAWVITDGAALDEERGVLKTGKEADVHLVERTDPATGQCILMAAKRYRPPDHRLFHRDTGYLEGRRTRRTRDTRALERRTAYGRALIADQWAGTEFAVLGRLWSGGVAVPYPVQRRGTELMMEFIGDPDTGRAAPRLAELERHDASLSALWDACVEALGSLGALGFTHGDLSAYNLLVHHGRVVLIDLPQVVDLTSNPRAGDYLRRDCHNLASWFARRGLAHADEEELVASICDAAGLPAP